MNERVARGASVATGLLILAIIGVAIVYGVQAGLSTLEQGGEAAQTLNLLLGAALGGLAYLYRSSREQRRVLAERLATDKRDLYRHYTDTVRDLFILGAPTNQKRTEAFAARLYKFAFDAILIASDDAVRAHIRFTNLQRIAPEDDQVALAAVADVLLALRQDLGFPDTKLTSRDLLGVVIKDVDADTLSSAAIRWKVAKDSWDRQMGWSSSTRAGLAKGPSG